MSPELIAGRYRVVRPVGHGGMGTVWLCHDEILGREVAVKQVGHLPGESVPDAARGLREARSSAALNHENVVSVFDVVETGDRIWLVMEYVPSRTLRQVLQEDGPLAPERAALLGAQVADGLAAAHARGTIHRDVKPGNVLVGDDGVAKISDFGIARMDGEEQLTRAGLVTGTPSYFAPELARGRDAGPEADVWALGATLYAAVEGEPPYPEQRNALATLQTIVEQDAPPALHAGILTTAIEQMMAREPASRWTMAEAAKTLHRLAEARPAPDEDTGRWTAPLPAVAGSPTDSLSHEEPARERNRSLVPLLLTAGALVVALVAGGFMLLDPGGSGENGDATLASERDTGTSPSAKPKPSKGSSGEPTPSEDATEESERPRTRKAQPAVANPAARMEQSVEEYFGLMPFDTDAGWSRLAPSMQAQGREAYESWWGSIESVDLAEADAVPGQDAVEVVVTYHFTDGRDTTETQRIYLERSAGSYLIADDEVLSSRTTN